MSTNATTRAELIGLVAAASQAPSVHNTQPWRFRLGEDSVEVHADRSRQLPVADPDGRSLRISCGAAVFNLRLAAAQLGRAAEVTLLPDHRDPDLLARVVAGRPRPASPQETALYAAIPRRHSNRQPFLDQPVPIEVRAALVDAATAEGAWLQLMIGPPALAMATELVRAADRILTADDAYRAELAAWTRRDDSTVDGVPHRASGSAPEPHDLLARRDFAGAARPPWSEYEAEPLVGVLGGVGDTPYDDLLAGQAIQRVLLTATNAGLVTSLISQPVDVPQVREQLRLGLRRTGAPQILLRAGYGVPGSPAPRRPVADVLLPDFAASR